MLYGNYHTHTARCGHAQGKDEEYVLNAIKLGLKELGFSDHVGLKGINTPTVRMDYSTIDEYVSSIKTLKEKYKDKIDIHIGFEAEYDIKYLNEYKDYLKNKGIEYLICGQHCYFENNQPVYYNSCHHDEVMLKKYFDDLTSAARSGLFKYICHPDLFMDGYGVVDDYAKGLINDFLKVVEEVDIPLEVNGCGLRFYYTKNKINPRGKLVTKRYSDSTFWDIVSQYNIRTIIGADVHDPNQLFDGSVDEAITFAKEHHLNLIDKIDI